MIINKKKCIEAATVGIPFLIGVIVGKLGMRERPKEAPAPVDAKETTEATEAEKEA